MTETQSEKLTQLYSTWGDKLLQHTDVLHSIQHEQKFKPVTIQLSPTEVCNSDCPFCSVAGRPIKSCLPFAKIKKLLYEFKLLGAKSVEITGGGNPLLYRDKEAKKNINDVIRLASDMGYDIGIITNHFDLKLIDPEVHDLISWIRVSLIMLDEGKEPEDYNFRGFPYSKLGFSYIIYESTGGVPDELSRTKKPYKGTDKTTIEKIVRLVELHPDIKFVRIAGNCLIKGNNASVRETYASIFKEVDKQGKIFIKDIGEDDGPFDDGCYVGLIRPYIAPHPDGGDYQVYTCTSHVLNCRTYDLAHSLGSVDDISEIWYKANESYATNGYPYEVNGNKGNNWCSECKYCYYKFNNKLLHTVANEMPDKNFP
jgi:hypothetical protein